MRATRTISLEDKLDHLRRPESFLDGPQSVEIVETHFAWVFFSRQFVYKLKKPIRFHGIDFTSLEKRKHNCELEATLNRRLAEAVYIGVVPLAIAGSGLRLEGEGEPVEWLVKMHRLPRDRTLDRLAAAGAVTDAETTALIAKLAAFYKSADRPPWTGADYVQHLTTGIEDYRRQLQALPAAAKLPTTDRLVAAQLRFVDQRRDSLERRADQGRIVDAHGDLRPEHIFLSDNPQIIDCLEFSAKLRLLDTAEEMSFLHLECERLGYPEIGQRLCELYKQCCGDPIAPELFAFYRSQRALIRALLCVWHLEDELYAASANTWLNRARWYLHAAGSNTGQALA